MAQGFRSGVAAHWVGLEDARDQVGRAGTQVLQTLPMMTVMSGKEGYRE
jgi:hypothetical protein